MVIFAPKTYSCDTCTSEKLPLQDNSSRYCIYPKYLDMWHQVRVCTVCHLSSIFFVTSAGSKI